MKIFYWKKSDYGDSAALVSFIGQLWQLLTGKEQVINLYNYNIHRSKNVKNETVSLHLFILSAQAFAGVQASRENMGLDQTENLWFFCCRWSW